MDINLLFGLIAFLGGIWAFLLRHILDPDRSFAHGSASNAAGIRPRNPRG